MGFLLLMLVVVICSTASCAPNIDQLKHERDVKGLIKALDYQAPEIRKDAARAPGTLGVSGAVEPLIVALQDADESVCEAAADALILIGKPAVEALGTVGDPQAVDLFIAFLEDDRHSTRLAAAEALGVIGDPRAVEPLIAALKGTIRTEAIAYALGKIGDPRAVEPLIAVLQGNSEEGSQAAAEALGVIGDPRAVDPLITALENWRYSVQISAAEALGIIGDPRAIKPLIGKLDHKVSDVRKKIMSALAQIGSDDPSMLLSFLKDESTVRVYLALIVLGNPATEIALIEALNAYGTDRMAMDYILCGNNNLATAAREWASKRGYRLIGTKGPQWGSER